MDISGISTSISANSTAAFSAARTDFDRAERSEGAGETRHRHDHRHGARRESALGAFRQELRMSLKAHFQMKFATSQQNYGAVQEPATTDDVAGEVLGAAKQIAAESPTTAAQSLISFRATVHETASYVREIVGASQGSDDIQNVVAKVDEGLNALEDVVSSNRESSASVLAVDTRTKQRSTIQIRTQEGDVVKLSLKRVDSLSATDVAFANGIGSASSTELEVSSRSRMILSVEGDLNETEMAAIQNVFAQAEQIADEFFGGDIGAAFDLAQGFEFDTEQLARVSLRFKMSEVSNVTYSESSRVAAFAPPTAPEVTAPPTATPGEVAAAVIAAPPLNDTTVAAPVETQVAEQSIAADPIAALDTSALESFMESLGAFLRTVGEGFAADSSSDSFRYHYSESFKLNLLKAVIHTAAPDDSGEAAEIAGLVIDGVAEDTKVDSV